MSYEAAIASFGGDDTTLAKSFIISLKNAAAKWYARLPPRSIMSWAQLKRSSWSISKAFRRILPQRKISSPASMSYPVFMPKPCTHHMHDPGSIVPHTQLKVFTDNQMLQIKYNYYYINSVSKDYDDSQWDGIAEDIITPQERKPGQHVA
jgi:hypothetical protein